MNMRCAKARKNISLALDGRLLPAARQALREHLRACPSCTAWQREQTQLAERLRTVPALQPSPGFYAALRRRMDLSPAPSRTLPFSSLFLPPALRQAALLLLLVFSALLGFFLAGRLEAPAAGAEASAFNQSMNLDAFADAPSGSFAAVYDQLLRGELK